MDLRTDYCYAGVGASGSVLNLAHKVLDGCLEVAVAYKAKKRTTYCPGVGVCAENFRATKDDLDPCTRSRR